jgi:phosphoribosylamine--glycine ligase
MGRLPETLRAAVATTALTVVHGRQGLSRRAGKGRRNRGLDEAEAIAGVTVFHAGTKREGDRLSPTAGACST